MSDSDSDDIPLGLNQRSLVDFPLTDRTIQATGRSLQQFEVDIRRLEQSLSRTRPPRSAAPRAPRAGTFTASSEDPHNPGLMIQLSALESLQSGRAQAHASQQMPPPRAEQDVINKGPRKPIVNLVPVLPPTCYKDVDDKAPKTSGYLTAQRAAVKYLGTISAHELSPPAANVLTQSIEPKTKEPTAAEALRLCYYMRSQGYDVYPKIDVDSKMMTLYIANPQSNVRGAQYDFMYWQQNVSTNQTERLYPPNTRWPRRNTLGVDTNLGGIHRATVMPQASFPVRDFPMPVTAAGQQAQFPDNSLPRAHTDFEGRLAQAQARLNFEFERPNSSPESIQACITVVEEARAQLDASSG